MSTYRKNTLVVDFSVLPKRPTLDQVEQFLKKFIKLDMADVKSIQLHNLKKCVYIELLDAGVAPRLHKQHHLQHSFVYDGVDYYVPIYVDGPTTTVRILDLPPHMSNAVITKHMQQYGKVISIQNEVWKNFFPGVPNGVRIVRMRMEKTVPSCIVVENHSTVVNYPNEQSARADLKQRTPTASSDINVENKIDDQLVRCEATEPSSTDSDGTNEAESDDEHAKTENNDGNGDDQQGSEITTELESGKRRLSTEADGMLENESKRTCSKNETSSDWRVHNTRSRKNKKCDV